MIKKCLVIFFTLISINIHADNIHDDYYEDGKKYTLVKIEADDYLNGYTKLLQNLSECKPYTFNYYNPLINQKGKYEIFGKDSNKNCILYLNYNNLREFKCNLNKGNINQILLGRIKLIKSKSGFGELSKNENEVYFNKNVCERAILNKNKVKEVSLEELKQTIDDPEMIQFLQLFGDKK
jgi:hypothetical protein